MKLITDDEDLSTSIHIWYPTGHLPNPIRILSSSASIIKAYGEVIKTLEKYPASLVAVSKRQPIERVEVLVGEGHKDFGENYLQEWQDKKPLLPSDLRWHYVGQLQSRKLKELNRDGIHMIHSVGSSSAVGKIPALAPLPPWLVQINLAGEDQKGGISEQEFHEMMTDQSRLPGLEGLMCIPPASLSGEGLRLHFRKMRELKEQYQLKELSMGMSSDWEMALDEGSTLVRLGSILFGERTPR